MYRRRMSSPPSAVTVTDLRIQRGHHDAVRGTTWQAALGAITVVLGPNGAGKTTSIEHLEGYLRRESGTSSVLGLDPQTRGDDLRPRVGVMLQGGGIQPAIRPLELLQQYASFFADPDSPEELLQRVGLAERARNTFRNLSGGEQQRLSLALALVGKPELLFLDEPTAGVDLSGRDLIRSLVRDLAGGGRSIVLTTHDIAEAEQLADHVVILHRGLVVAQGAPSTLVSKDSDTLRFSADPGLDLSSLSDHIGATVTETTPGGYVVEAAPQPALVSSVASWLAQHDQTIGDIRAENQTLEDVFRAVTTEGSGPSQAPESAEDQDAGISPKPGEPS